MKYPKFPVLIIDDEAGIAKGCKLTLLSNGITNIVTCLDSRKVMPLLSGQEMQLILLDLLMPHISGQELLRDITERYPHVPIVVFTGINEVETAINCIKEGAVDYLVKPVEERRLVSVIRNAVERQEERDEYLGFKQLVLSGTLEHPEAFSEIISVNKTMRSIFQYAETIAKTNKPVLITGESGTGKGMIAKAVHKISRREGSFVSVNTAGLDDNLFSDSMFGHIKGAYTNAVEKRQGLVQQAADGTLFLDEIGDLSLSSQVKLLRLLEEGEFFPIGSDIPRKTNIRILTATNKDIHLLQKKEKFRADLSFRLKTHHIHLPPMRERFDDLPILLNHFLKTSSKALGKKRPTPPKELISLLNSYHFPGNVRELQSMVFDAVSRHTSKVLSMKHFNDHVNMHRSQNDKMFKKIEDGNQLFAYVDKLPDIKTVRILLIKEALKRCRGKITLAARILGMSQPGLSKLLKREELR